MPFLLAEVGLASCAACAVKKGPSFVHEETTSAVLTTGVNWLCSVSANLTCQL